MDMPEEKCSGVSDSERKWREEAAASIGRAAEEARAAQRVKSVAMSKAVKEAIENVGQFIVADGVPHVKIFGRVIPLDQKADDLRNLLTAIGVNAASTPFKWAVEELKTFCDDHGEAATVRRFSHYDQENHRLYVSNNDGCMFRLDGEKLEYVPNGTDGVFFLPEPGVMPVEVDQALDAYHAWRGGTRFLDRLVLRLIRASGRPLSTCQAQDVVRAWILAALADLPTRPLLLLYGEKDCGKTTAARAVVRALLGPGFDVTVAGGRKDFEAAVTNLPVVFFDNVDAHVKWLQDSLAVVATGFTVTRRELYTTDRLGRFDSVAFVGLTSREALFRRDDVNSRLLVVRLAPLDGHDTEQNLLRAANHPWARSRLIGEALRVVNEALARRFKKLEFPRSFRMADFAEWGQAVSEVLGQPTEAWSETLARLDHDQSVLLLEKDPLLPALTKLVDSHSGGDEGWTAGKLYGHLAELGGDEFMGEYHSPESLAHQLGRKAPALAVHGIEVSSRDNTHLGQKVWHVARAKEAA